MRHLFGNAYACCTRAFFAIPLPLHTQSVDAKCALHEIQYGVVGGSFHGSRTSSTNSVVVGSLTPGTAYRFRVRGTAIDEVSGWTDYAATWTCATSSQSATRRSDAVPSASDKEELFAVYRVSERQIAGMPYLDFLSNHNAGTAAGDVGFLTAARAQCALKKKNHTKCSRASLANPACVSFERQSGVEWNETPSSSLKRDTRFALRRATTARSSRAFRTL